MAEDEWNEAELWAAVDLAAQKAGSRPSAEVHARMPVVPVKTEDRGGHKRQFDDGKSHQQQQQQQQRGSFQQQCSNRRTLELPNCHEMVKAEVWTLQQHYQQQQQQQQLAMPSSCGIPSSSLFKQLQDSAMRVLEKGDYMMLQGKPFIKKSGWRKIAFFFNLSFEIRDRKIELDQSDNVLRAEFLVRATMQSGRFSDGWGSCDAREKRFSKPNHDIPCTAETRAKTRACQDLVGIGEYKGSSVDSW